MRKKMKRCLLFFLAVHIFALAAVAQNGGQAPQNLTLFKDIMNLELNAGSQVSDNKITFNCKGSPWGSLFSLMGGLLEDDTAYVLEFDYILECEPSAENYIIVVVRDMNFKKNDFASSSLPTKPGKFMKGRVNFKTLKGAGGYAVMFHMHGKLKGEIKNLTLRQADDTTSFRPFSANAEAFDESKLKKIPTGAKEFSVDLPTPKNGLVVSAADFGLNENVDNAAAIINKALEHCRKTGASKLVIPRGTYKSFDGTQIIVQDFEDFTIDGQGSTIIINKNLRKSGPSTLSIARCKRTLLENLNFDWDWNSNPLASVVEVVGGNDKYFDIKFLEYEDFPQKDVRIGIFSAYDPKTKSVGIENGKTLAFNMFVGRGKPVETQWIASNILRIKTKNPFEAGELYRLQHSYYEYGCVSMLSNTHLTLRNFNIYSCSGHAFTVSGTQKYWHFDNVNIVRPPNSERRAITTTADHLHIAQSQGYMKMENCEFSLGADDCINMHDCSIIMDRESDETLLSVNTRNSYLYNEGEEIELRQDDFSPAGFTGKVIEKTLVDKERKIYRVRLDKPIPEMKGVYFVLFSKKYDTRNMIVRNCYFHDNRARGVLILARDVTVENCRFFHNEMGAIKIETGFTGNSWCEGYGVENVVVRNCTFDTCNPSGSMTNGYERDIYMGVYLFTDPSYRKTDYPILRDIMFENNTFKDTFGVVAVVTSVRNLIFRNNTFSNPTPRKNPLKYRGCFYVGWSRDVSIVNNKFILSENISDLGVYIEKGTVKRLKIQGNSFVEN